MTKTALVLIDIQNDYFKGGAFELPKMEQVSTNAAKLLTHFRASKAPIFHIQHKNTAPDAVFFRPDGAGVHIHDSVAPQEGETHIIKHRPNSFHQTSLCDDLKKQGIENLILCGAMTFMCIEATARAAVDYGFNVSIIEDACAARALSFKNIEIKTEQVHAAFMAALAMSYASILDTDTFLKA